MSKTLKLWGVFSVIAFLVAGCASTVHVEKDDTVDFRDYKTFAWVDKDGEGKSDRNKQNDLTEEKSGERRIKKNRRLERSKEQAGCIVEL
jgi:hypothetical protein